MSKADETKQYIIEKTVPVFNKKGYAGTSMADIIEATGLTKGSIYGNFENKEEVATEVFKYHASMLTNTVYNTAVPGRPAIDQLLAITEFYRGNWERVAKRGGCPILNASVEADDNVPFLKKIVQETIKRWIKNLSGIIDLGKTQGSVREDIDTKKYATTIISLIEGGIMLAKITTDPQMLLNTLDRIDLIIRQELAQ